MPLRKRKLNKNEALKFGSENAKLEFASAVTKTFRIPSGYTCPGAVSCLSRFNQETNKVEDGRHADHRCYSTSAEAAFPSVRKLAHGNFQKLMAAGGTQGMAELILSSLPKAGYTIRIHEGGDFFSEAYFLAWCAVAEEDSGRTFYAYTKSLAMWVRNLDRVPSNLVITASRGGRWDDLIEYHGLKNERTIAHPEEAEILGLPVDHNDDLARDPDVPAFALLIHNTQPKGSEMAEARARMRQEGVEHSYSR
jgi:hypothetical protein